MQDQLEPAVLSYGADNAMAAALMHWMNIATSALVLAGFVVFLGLVVQNGITRYLFSRMSFGNPL